MQAATEQQMQQIGKMTKIKMIKTIQPPLSGQPDSSLISALTLCLAEDVVDQGGQLLLMLYKIQRLTSS